MPPTQTIKSLTIIPSIGKSIAVDLYNIEIRGVDDLKGKDTEVLYDSSNRIAGCVLNRCLLYVFRYTVYFAKTPADQYDSEKLKWWNKKDKT